MAGASIAPRPVETARRLHKLGQVRDENLATVNASSGQTDANTPMLPDTRIWTINDRREQVAAAFEGEG